MDMNLPDYEFDFEAVFDADDYLYFYRESLTDERTHAEVQGLVDLIHLEKPMKILDLACGFGRHTNRLAALGHEMTGVDLYSDFLYLARQEATENNLHVSYVQGDMREIRYVSEFDRILLLFSAFGYFSDEENFLVIENIYRALRTGGKFIFDVLNRDTFLKYISSFYVTEIAKDLMIDRVSFNPLTGRLRNRRFVIRNGERKEKPFTHRLYNASEIIELLQRAGFKEIKFFSSWTGLAVDAESRRLIVVTEK